MNVKKLFENIVGKEENAGNQHFLLFPQCFLSYARQKSLCKQQLDCLLQMPENLSFGLGLSQHPIETVDCLFVLDFTPYQQYFNYLTATVHRSMFSWLFLNSTYVSSQLS